MYAVVCPEKNVALCSLPVEFWGCNDQFMAVDYLSRDFFFYLEDIWPKLWTERALLTVIL
jgi:hypothetical protein